MRSKKFAPLQAPQGEAQPARRAVTAASQLDHAWRVCLSGMMIAVLAACGGASDSEDGSSSGSGGGQSGGSTTTITVPAPCTTAPAAFNSTVWSSLSPTCTGCHITGGVASGTRLVFTGSSGTIGNYNVLRDYARDNSALLLSKTIGQPSHAGGAPFVNEQSTQYRNLQALIPEMVNQVCTTTTTVVTPGATSDGFLRGVTLSNDATALAKASVLFAGRNPTTTEAEAVSAGGSTALRQTIRSYLQGPAFDAFLNEVGDTHFLTPAVSPRDRNMGYVLADWPTAGALLGATGVTQAPGSVMSRFDASVRKEPIELMKYIVKNDRPFTDIVSGNYTVANGILAQYLGAQVDGSFANVDDDNEFRRATLPSHRLGGTREHAGVLSTLSWLQRFPTTPTNRNRHRVATLYKQFLATDLNALAVRPLDDGASFRVPTVENPDCAACHATMDPVAAGFQNWDERNRYLPNRTSAGVDHALPATYLSGRYPRDANNMAYYRAGDNWFRDGASPGYGATPMPGGFTGNRTSLQWLGQQVASDPRFALGAVHFWYEGVFGRAPLAAPTDQSSPQYAAQQAAYVAQNNELRAIATRFATDRGYGAYNVRDLLVDLILSPLFRAERTAPLTATRAAELADVGSMNLLTPGQLNRKLMGVVGQGWNEFDNPNAGWGLNYGDFDGIQRTVRAKSQTMMQLVTIDRLVAVRSCSFTKTDFDKPVANRLLFPRATLADLPSTTTGREAIEQNIRHLHKALWKEDLPVSDPEVQRTLKLFTDVWGDRATAPTRPVSCVYNNTNDPNYTGRAWAAVIAYMLGDPKFLYE